VLSAPARREAGGQPRMSKLLTTRRKHRVLFDAGTGPDGVVHLRQPGICEVAGVDPRRDERGDHPVDPVALPGRRRGVEDLLGVLGLDVLAGDRR
jgi:hypothetical protein